ncbi:MAG: NUDIX domain-containing protein [Gammaproteobacteria bacterium]|nr:NUDIX domain-containing protein [Gammaproteobacteria bacterium]
MSPPAHEFSREWARFCPRCGADSLSSDDGRRHQCAQCGFVYFHNLAAAVCVMLRRGEELALVVRGQDPGRGLLDLPGGFVDPDEDLEAAAVREVREELGVAINNPRYLFSVPNLYRYREVNYRTLDAMFEVWVNDLPPVVPNAEVTALYWRELASVKPEELAFASVRAALARLRGAFP